MYNEDFIQIRLEIRDSRGKTGSVEPHSYIVAYCTTDSKEDNRVVINCKSQACLRCLVHTIHTALKQMPHALPEADHIRHGMFGKN